MSDNGMQIKESGKQDAVSKLIQTAVLGESIVQPKDFGFSFQIMMLERSG